MIKRILRFVANIRIVRRVLRGLVRLIDRIAPTRYNNLYECTDCGVLWNNVGHAGELDTCPDCGLPCYPYEFDELRN